MIYGATAKSHNTERYYKHEAIVYLSYLFVFPPHHMLFELAYFLSVLLNYTDQTYKEHFIWGSPSLSLRMANK